MRTARPEDPWPRSGWSTGQGSVRRVGSWPGSRPGAARSRDGWVPWRTPPDEIPAKIDRIGEPRYFDGRPSAVFYSLMSTKISVGDGGHEARDGNIANLTDRQRVIEDCGRLAELEVTDTWVPLPPVPNIDECFDYLRWDR